MTVRLQHGAGRRHSVVFVLALTLLTTACGARFTPEQKLVARGGGSSGVAAGDAAAGDGAGVAQGGASLPGGPGAATGAGARGAAGGATGAGTGAGPATTGGGGAGGAAASGDTRLAPPGGNGGATDKGVTADKIVISNISDVGGAVPGLFEDAQLATKAYLAYFSARQGTLYGRKFSYLPLDARLDIGANRSATIQACAESFAAVGSLSATDQGGAPVMQNCGLASIPAMILTNQARAVPNNYSVVPLGNGKRGIVTSLGGYGWPAKRFSDAIKSAALLYASSENVAQSIPSTLSATRKIGYNWVYTQAIDIQETNYAPFVLNMKSKGVKAVFWIGHYQASAKLAQAMQQQDFKPELFAPGVTAYSNDFLAIAGSAADGAYLPLTTAPLEEAGKLPELQLYRQWLNQVSPDARPTPFGMQAWAAAKLFVEIATRVGPKLTRKAVLAELAKVNAYDGGGLLSAKHNIAAKTPSDCVVWVRLQKGRFVRVEPAGGGYRCGDGIVYQK